MDDVDVSAGLQFQHDLQVGVVLAQPALRWHGHVAAGGVAQVERTHQELSCVQPLVAARPGEHRDLHTALPQAPDELPGQ